MEVSVDELTSITKDVWSSMLGLECEETPTGRPEGELPCYMACLQILGEFEGAVTIQLRDALARRVTSAMFGMDEIDDELIRDALGEIVNIVGGNVKNTLPQPSRISLPTVVRGNDFDFTIPGCRTVSESLLSCEEEVFTITLLKKERSRA